MPPIGPDSIVVAYLREPREMIWGVLKTLDVAGIQIQGIPLPTFNDWVREIASSEVPSIGLSTLFYPIQRVEKILLDDEVGEVPSLQRQFYEKLNMTVEEYLGLPEA